jgi:hypothetical protein
VSWLRAALAAAVVLSLQACGKEDIDLTGKACPCPSSSDFECDSVCQVCVPVGTAPGSQCSGTGASAGMGGNAGAGGGTTGGSAGTSSGGTGGVPCTPAITFQGFKAAWATPESIRWEWEPLSPATAKDLFKTYEIEVTTPGETPRVFDGSTNPELGAYVQPNSGLDFTSATTTSGLTPGKLYSGVLRAIDTQDCAFASPVTSAPKTTQPKGGSFELYAENQPAGAVPLDASVVTAGCRAGECLRSSDCTTADCFFNLRWSNTTLSAPITAGEFVDAYMEFYVKSDSAAPLWWCGSRLQLGATEFWYFNPYSVAADDQYHKIQIPLRWFQTSVAELDYSTFTSQSLTDVSFIGGSPTVGTHIWVDDAYLRW